MLINSTTTLPITSIRLFPKLTGSVLNFDPSKAPKDWSAKDYIDNSPVIEGYYIFTFVETVDRLPKFVKHPMLISDAIAFNTVPPNYTYLQGSKIPSSISCPVDISKIPVGYELGTDFMGNPALCKSDTPVTPSEFTKADHDALMEILTFVRK